MKNIQNLLDKLHINDLTNPLHPSLFDENEEYDMLILRLPVIEEVLVGKSLGFVFSSEKSYFFDKQSGEFEELEDPFLSAYSIMNRVVDKLLKDFLNYQEKIADMEEYLYADESSEEFLNEWLSIKVELLRIERILLRSASVMEQFMEYYKERESFPMNHYVDIHEHIERTMRSAALQLSKLDYLYSFYNAKSNDKMNKMIYLLTIISAIFLPLNLLVGFFGMNTTNLPFSEGSNGTFYAISLMASIVIITTLFVQKWRKKVER